MDAVTITDRDPAETTPTSSYDTTGHYVPGLDGLRALGILLVFGIHGQWKFANGGSVGVDVFFVLSGYLITQLLMREFVRHDTIDLTNFYARRFVRLFPPLAAMCLVFTAYCIHARNIQLALGNVIPGITYISNYTRGRFGHPDYLAQLWSLSTEEQFYLIWPALLLILARLDRTMARAKTVVFVLIAAIIVWRMALYATHQNIVRVYDGLDTHGDGLMMGCALGLASQSVVSRVARFWPLGLAVLLGWVRFGAWDNPILYWGGFTVIAASAASLVASAVTHRNAVHVAILSSKPARILGRLSYGAYLWHYPIINVLQARYGFSPHRAMLLGGTLAFLIAAASYHWLERPLLDARSSLSPRAIRCLALAGPVVLALGVLYAVALTFRFIT